MSLYIIRLCAATELGLTMAEVSGWFDHLVPIGNSHAVQLALIGGVAILLPEIRTLGAEAIEALRTWWHGDDGR